MRHVCVSAGMETTNYRMFVEIYFHLACSIFTNKKFEKC